MIPVALVHKLNPPLIFALFIIWIRILKHFAGP